MSQNNPSGQNTPTGGTGTGATNTPTSGAGTGGSTPGTTRDSSAAGGQNLTQSRSAKRSRTRQAPLRISLAKKCR
jgi:hypothetical protein